MLEINFEKSIELSRICKSKTGKYDYKSTIYINGVIISCNIYDDDSNIYRLKYDCQTYNIDENGEIVHKYLKDNENLKEEYEEYESNCDEYYEIEIFNTERKADEPEYFGYPILSDDKNDGFYITSSKKEYRHITWNVIIEYIDLDDIIKEAAEKEVNKINKWFNKL